MISFLYPRGYYDALTSRLKNRHVRRNLSRPGTIRTKFGTDDYLPIPDRIRTDTISLYPGMLNVEDFVAKVEKKLASAEALGMPYTGVLS